MMTNKAFSLVELMVGLLVNLFLVAAIAAFMGSTSYGFQKHKQVVMDRGHLRRNLAMMSREIMES